MYETVFPSELVNESELKDLVQIISEVTTQPFEIKSQIVVSTESVNLSSMLDDLRDAICKKEEPKPSKAKTKPKGNAAKAGKRSVEINGEVISSQAFNKRLVAHEFVPGTIVKSSIHGKGNIADDGETCLWGLPS